MPFKPDLRKRLQDLKSELDSGILPKSLYEEMCREAILEYGNDPFDSSGTLYHPQSYQRPGPGENVAVLTPVQQSILEAIGDIGDISMIVPFIRRLRKKVLRTASQQANASKNRVQCPECGKDFLNTQGLSTHLLAKHRKALDDYYLNTESRKLILKPEGFKSSTNTTIPTGVVSASNGSLGLGSDNHSKSALDNDKTRLETAESMANLVSAAMDRSQGGDGLWLVKQVDQDSDSEDIDDDDDGDSSSSSTSDDGEVIFQSMANKSNENGNGNKSKAKESSSTSSVSNSVAATTAVSSTSKESIKAIDDQSFGNIVDNNSMYHNDHEDNFANVPDNMPMLDSVSLPVTMGTVSRNAIPSPNPKSASISLSITDGASVANTNISFNNSYQMNKTRFHSSEDDSSGPEERTDRRKFNRGTQSRKSYSKDTKLSVIGMRDQGKCTDEISVVMGIPKSNIEKWCSAKGREKILRDIYRDVVSQRPRSFGTISNRPLLPDAATTSLAQQLPPPIGLQPSTNKSSNASLSNSTFTNLFGIDKVNSTMSSYDNNSLSVYNSKLTYPIERDGMAGILSLSNPNNHGNSGLAYKVSSGISNNSNNNSNGVSNINFNINTGNLYSNNIPQTAQHSNWSYSIDSSLLTKGDSISDDINISNKKQRTGSNSGNSNLSNISNINSNITNTANNSALPPALSGSSTGMMSSLGSLTSNISSTMSNNPMTTAMTTAMTTVSNGLSGQSSMMSSSSSGSSSIPMNMTSNKATRKPPANTLKASASYGGKSKAPGTLKRKPAPTSSATAAAVLAQNISFNNDGFSDSDDDNEVMGLLGEQLPIVALHRLTQMRPS